jgi:drug/metabolite transporter (DMT)-like permease
MSPMFTAIFSVTLFGESLRRKTSSGIIIATLGAFILAWNDISSILEGALIGDLLAIISAVFLSVYFLGGQKYARGIPNSVYTSIIYLSASFVTLMQCLVMQLNVLAFESSEFLITEMLIFLALAIFPTALGHSVNNYLLTIVPAYVVSSVVLGEPIGATILGILIFGNEQIPTVIQLIGFVTILVGIAFVLSDLVNRKQELPPIP